MVAPGTQHFTSLTIGKEATAGTSVATTREWYGDGTGELNVDPMISDHAGNRGTRTSLSHATSKGEAVEITFNTDADTGWSFDDLIVPFSQLKGGVTGVAGTSDYTWTYAPSQTGANSQEAFTVEVTDDIQCWECTYSQMRSFEIGASMDSMTTGTANFFARSATKVTQTAVAANQSVRIPGYLWIPKFAASQAGIAGASTSTGLLKNWRATYQTGLRPDRTMSGTTFFTQSVEALDQTVHIEFDLESSATAVAEYDKFKAQTVTFMQLAATTMPAELPDITSSLNAVRMLKATRERGPGLAAPVR